MGGEGEGTLPVRETPSRTTSKRPSTVSGSRKTPKLHSAVKRAVNCSRVSNKKEIDPLDDLFLTKERFNEVATKFRLPKAKDVYAAAHSIDFDHQISSSKRNWAIVATKLPKKKRATSVESDDGDEENKNAMVVEPAPITTKPIEIEMGVGTTEVKRRNGRSGLVPSTPQTPKVSKQTLNEFGPMHQYDSESRAALLSVLSMFDNSPSANEAIEYLAMTTGPRTRGSTLGGEEDNCSEMNSPVHSGGWDLLRSARFSNMSDMTPGRRRDKREIDQNENRLLGSAVSSVGKHTPKNFLKRSTSPVWMGKKRQKEIHKKNRQVRESSDMEEINEKEVSDNDLWDIMRGLKDPEKFLVDTDQMNFEAAMKDSVIPPYKPPPKRPLIDDMTAKEIDEYTLAVCTNDALRHFPNVETLRSLLELGANPNAPIAAGGRRPLHVAAMLNYPEIITLLMDFEADIALTCDLQRLPLHESAAHGHLESCLRLLRLTKVPVIDKQDIVGRTAMHEAAARGYTRILVEITRRGANARLGDKQGCTPLHLAALAGHCEIVRTLIHMGIGCDTCDISGKTPLHDAVREGHVDVVRLLLKNRTNFNQRDVGGYTTLDHAMARRKWITNPFAKDKYREICALLLEYGAHTGSQLNEYGSAHAIAHIPTLDEIDKKVHDQKNQRNIKIPSFSEVTHDPKWGAMFDKGGKAKFEFVTKLTKKEDPVEVHNRIKAKSALKKLLKQMVVQNKLKGFVSGDGLNAEEQKERRVMNVLGALKDKQESTLQKALQKKQEARRASLAGVPLPEAVTGGDNRRGSIIGGSPVRRRRRGSTVETIKTKRERGNRNVLLPTVIVTKQRQKAEKSLAAIQTYSDTDDININDLMPLSISRQDTGAVLQDDGVRRSLDDNAAIYEKLRPATTSPNLPDPEHVVPSHRPASVAL